MRQNTTVVLSVNSPYLFCFALHAAGRARADKAKYCLVAEQGRGVADKEMYNKIRETMMQQAIEIIQHDRKPDEIRQKIRKFQKEAKVCIFCPALTYVINKANRDVKRVHFTSQQK
jgi:hypothetical protein